MTVAEFRKAFDRLTSHGWLTFEEAALLVDYAERTRGPIVEVGSYMGRSAMLFAQLRQQDHLVHVAEYAGDWLAIKDSEPLPPVPRQVVCIDPWDETFSNDYSGQEIMDRFCANVASISGAFVTPVRCRVEDWKPIFAEFVYLDGDHTREGTLTQIKKALQCKPKYIAVHDVNDSGEGAEVKRAAVELLGEWLERIGKVAVWGVTKQ